MSAGKLDRRVWFMRPTYADDGFNMVPTYATHGGPIWAQKTEASDSERWRAGEVVAAVSCRFLVRHSTFTEGLEPADRMVCDGQIYEIFGTKEVTEHRKRWIEISAGTLRDDDFLSSVNFGHILTDAGELLLTEAGDQILLDVTL